MADVELVHDFIAGEQNWILRASDWLFGGEIEFDKVLIVYNSVMFRMAYH